MRARVGPAIAVAILAAVGQAAAQGASPYLAIHDWTTPYVEYLIRTGVIVDPDPLTRPLHRQAVLAALKNADTVTASQAVRETVRRLVAWLGPPDTGGVVYRAEGDIGGAVATQRRRDELHPAGSSYAAYHGDARLSMTAGSVVASVHPYANSYLCIDPDFTGRLTCRPPGRLTDAYLSVQGRYGELFFGATDRNWGIPEIDGFLTSAYPYSYDHLYARVGTRDVSVEVLTTQLDDAPDSLGQPVHRFWMSSRVRIQPWPWLMASFDNATLWYGDRWFELRFLNPLKISYFTFLDDNVDDKQNNVLAGDVRILLPRHMTLQSSVLVDGIRSFGFLGGSHEDLFPDRLGWMAALDAPLGRGIAGRVWGQVVTAFAYRATEGLQNSIMLRGVGLGQNYADNIEAGAQVSFFPAPMVNLSPELAFLKQGEGDFRLPTPLGFVPGPTLFAGTVETTWRVGIKGQARLWNRVDLDGDAGVHFTRNTGHVAGINRTTFVGRLAVSYQLFNEAILGH